MIADKKTFCTPEFAVFFNDNSQLLSSLCADVQPLSWSAMKHNSKYKNSRRIALRTITDNIIFIHSDTGQFNPSDFLRMYANVILTQFLTTKLMDCMFCVKSLIVCFCMDKVAWIKWNETKLLECFFRDESKFRATAERSYNLMGSRKLVKMTANCMHITTRERNHNNNKLINGYLWYAYYSKNKTIK